MDIKIGDKVIKKSGKPFKSGYKINTVKGIVTNFSDPLRRQAFVFEEDDSCVNVEICMKYS